MAEHPFAAAHRRAKARRIADALWAHLGPDSPSALDGPALADHLDALTEHEWARAAELVGERAPSAETRRIVITLIRTRVPVPADDPFVGLPR